MAKIKPGNVAPGAIPGSRGRIVVAMRKHVIVAQSPPRPRGKAKSGYNFFREKEFGIAARWASSPIDLELATAIEMVKGTTYVPRDFIMRAIFGRAYIIENEDGFKWPNFRDVTNNPQYVLDQITTTVGSIFYRADIGWVGLPPSDDSFVLTMQGNLPIWKTLPEPYAPPDVQTLLDQLTDEPGSVIYRDDTGWVALPPGIPLQVLTLDDDGFPIWADTQYVAPPTPPFSVLKVAEVTSVAALATISWTGLNLGPLATDRHILAAVGTSRSSAIGARSISSLVLNGVGMTPLGTELQFGAQATLNLFSVANFTDLTAAMTLNLSAANAAHAVTLYSVSGLPSFSPHAFATSSGNPASGTINVPAAGFAIGMACGAGGTLGALTLTGLNPDNDATVGGVCRFGAGSVAGLPANATYPIGASSTANAEAYAVASFAT